MIRWLIRLLILWAMSDGTPHERSDDTNDDDEPRRIGFRSGNEQETKQ